MATLHSSEFHNLYQKEKDQLKIEDKERVMGLSISGGGIRSASFGLGIIQGLVASGHMQKLKFLSTVSGGGFIGSALTWALKQNPDADLTSEKFPLGKKSELGKSENNFLINYLRQHGNYLMPTSELGTVSFAAVVLRSMFISFVIYGGLLTLTMMLLFNIGLLGVHPFSWIKSTSSNSHNLYVIRQYVPDFFEGNLILQGAFIFLSVIVIFYLSYTFISFFYKRMRFKPYRGFLWVQKTLGITWKVTIALILIGIIPMLYEYLVSIFGVLAAESAVGSTLIGIATSIWQYSKAQNEDTSSSLMSDLMLYAGAALLLYGILMGAYILAVDSWFYVPGHGIEWPPTIVLIAFVLGASIFSNLNLISPHRIWRNRLMETFMPARDAVLGNKWAASYEANTAKMETCCNDHIYHIVNTNVILVNSEQTRYRNRGGDNFIVSPLYCGSDATGWIKTDEYQQKRGGITLATAMAASGAALNPNAAVSGEGMTRNTVISMLLSFFNLGLGYWASNPSDPSNKIPKYLSPGISSLLVRGMSEEKKLIQLSDGGHFENTAIYELIRRRQEVILLCDGGADLAYNFDDFANAVEKIRVDFGVKIKFKNHDYGLDDTMPASAVDGKEEHYDKYIKQYEIAKNGFAIGTITYPKTEREDEKTGILVLFKPTMIKDVASDVYSYKGVNPDFPQESTADQFYDEKQFEAYRELGYSIAWEFSNQEKNIEYVDVNGQKHQGVMTPQPKT